MQRRGFFIMLPGDAAAATIWSKRASGRRGVPDRIANLGAPVEMANDYPAALTHLPHRV
jgi:hypothetical protein